MLPLCFLVPLRSANQAGDDVTDTKVSSYWLHMYYADLLTITEIMQTSECHCLIQLQMLEPSPAAQMHRIIPPAYW